MTDRDRAAAAYIRSEPDEVRDALLHLRAAILSAEPGCEETVRRHVPAYRLDGKPLVSIGAARRHVSLYVMYGSALHHLADRLAGLDVSKTVVRFDPARPIPLDLVTDIVRFRAREIRHTRSTR